MTFLLLGLLSSTSILASDQLNFYSRNMPETCDFVYQVESDLKWTITDSTIKNPQIYFQYKDSWSKEKDPWQRQVSKVNFIWNPSKKRWEADVTLMSMKTSDKYLYRDIRFDITEKSETHFTPKWQASFGREFGEACSPQGRPGTPYLQRIIENL